MKRHDKLADTLPVGTLGILALESSHDTVSYTHLTLPTKA